MADASITIGADATAVQRATAVAKAAVGDLASSLTSALGGAVRGVVSDLGNLALAQGKVNFGQQQQQVREFEAATARMGVAAGRDLEQIRSGLERTGVAIGKRPGEVAQWATAVAHLTHDFNGAAQAAEGLAGLAAMTGRSLDDYRGLAATLSQVGMVAGDTTHAVGMLAAQARDLGVKGGVDAFAGQVEALGDTISHFAIKGEGDFLKVTAAAGALGKGLSDPQARRVQSSVLGSIASDSMGWGRFLGHDITDEETGQVKDPTKVMKEIAAKLIARHGKGAEGRRAFQWAFNPEAGARFFQLAKTGKLDDLDKASVAAPSAAPAAALAALKATDAGKREVAEAELAQSGRALLGSSTRLGSAADALQRWASTNPITTTLVSSALSIGAGNFASKFGTALATLMGGKGEGGAVGGIADLLSKGGKAGAGGILKTLGAAGLAAGSVGYAVSEISSTVNELGGGKRVWRDFLDAGMPAAVSRGNVGFAAQEEQNRRNLELAKRNAALAIPAMAMGMTPQELGAALANAIGDKLKVEVTNASDTPISAATKNATSTSAGAQGG